MKVVFDIKTLTIFMISNRSAVGPNVHVISLLSLIIIILLSSHVDKKLNQTTLKIYHAGTTGSPTGNITVEKRGGKLHFNTGKVGKILYESELRPKFYNSMHHTVPTFVNLYL